MDMQYTNWPAWACIKKRKVTGRVILLNNWIILFNIYQAVNNCRQCLCRKLGYKTALRCGYPQEIVTKPN